MDKWIDRLIDRQMNRQIDGWKDRWMNDYISFRKGKTFFELTNGLIDC